MVIDPNYSIDYSALSRPSLSLDVHHYSFIHRNCFRKYEMYHLPYLDISGHLARMHLALGPGSRTSIQGASFCEETPADSPWLMSSFNHVFHFTPLNTVQNVHWYLDSDWMRVTTGSVLSPSKCRLSKSIKIFIIEMLNCQMNSSHWI